MPPGSSRVHAIDGLRGLLATLVVAWHVCEPFGVTWMLTVANGAVAMFFLLSGYALTRGWDGRFGIFLVRRFIRLWPVYALCLAMGFVIAGVSPRWSYFLWFPLIRPDTQPVIDHPIRSLFLEVWAMPLMPLIIWAGRASLSRAAICVLALLLAGLVVPQIAVLVLFVAGAYLARETYRSRLLESPWVQWLGRISYSLYLSHYLVLKLATRSFGPWGGVAIVPVIFLTAWAVWWSVERPSILLSRRVARAITEMIATWRPKEGLPTPS